MIQLKHALVHIHRIIFLMLHQKSTTRQQTSRVAVVRRCLWLPLVCQQLPFILPHLTGFHFRTQRIRTRASSVLKVESLQGWHHSSFTTLLLHIQSKKGKNWVSCKHLAETTLRLRCRKKQGCANFCLLITHKFGAISKNSLLRHALSKLRRHLARFPNEACHGRDIKALATVWQLHNVSQSRGRTSLKLLMQSLQWSSSDRPQP